MILSLIAVVLVLVIAYWHYLQGFFSAGLSAIFAIIAAVLAVGYHEVLIGYVNGGKYSDYATSVVLCAIFALVYLVLRLIFDKAVPGNVTFPLLVDRIGGAAAGAVAGVFTVGVVMIAAQALPFGASIAGFERYPIKWDQQAILKVPNRPQNADAYFYSLEDPDKFVRNEGGDSNALMIPADRLVLATVDHVSADTGSLASGKPLRNIHPDYLQELFGQRLSIQSGSKKTAMLEDAAVIGVFTAPSLPQDDQERWENEGIGVGVRHPKMTPAPPPLGPTFKPEPGRMLLVLRTTLGSNAADKTGKVSFSPAAVRLCIKGKSYFPIGTVEAGRVLFRNTPDDLLFVVSGKAADFVFDVPEDEALSTPGALQAKDKTAQPAKLADGAFLEFKRFARRDLGGMEVKAGIAPPGGMVEVVRKEGAPPGGATIAVKTPLSLTGNLRMDAQLFTDVNVSSQDDNIKNTETDWGQYTVQEGKFSKLEVNPVRTVKLISTGTWRVREFMVPANNRMVQLDGRPAQNVDNKWEWANSMQDYTLTDNNGQRHTPVGFVAKLNNNGQEMMLVRYELNKATTSIASVDGMRPTDVTLLYVLPGGTEIKSLEYKGDLIKPMSMKVPY